MPIERAEVETRITHQGIGREFSVPVLFTDELTKTRPLDLAYSSASGGVLPYLFTGYFTDGEGFHKWYFANARRHEEMREAVEHYLGRTDLLYVYGQIYLDDRAAQNWKVLFTRVTLHSPLPEEKLAKKLLRKAIKSKYLRDDFEILIV